MKIKIYSSNKIERSDGTYEYEHTLHWLPIIIVCSAIFVIAEYI